MAAGMAVRAVVRRKGPHGQVIEDRPDLVAAAENIAAKYGLSAVFNFQTKDQRGQAHLLEINARASGGLRYSMAAGINFPRLLLDAATKAKEIANGGDAYPVGAREMASRLAADLPTKAETIKSIVHRVG